MHKHMTHACELATEKKTKQMRAIVAFKWHTWQPNRCKLSCHDTRLPRAAHRYEVAVLLTEGRGAAPAIYRGTLSPPHEQTEN